MESTPIVYVGKKGMSFYLNVCLKLLEKGAARIVVEALGSNICKAVDVYNYLKYLFGKDSLEIEKVEVDMVEGETIRGLPKKVSRIRIFIVDKSKLSGYEY